MKENFTRFWSYSYKGAAKRFFKAWSSNAMRSKSESVKKVVKMLRRYEEGLLNLFSTESATPVQKASAVPSDSSSKSLRISAVPA